MSQEFAPITDDDFDEIRNEAEIELRQVDADIDDFNQSQNTSMSLLLKKKQEMEQEVEQISKEEEPTDAEKYAEKKMFIEERKRSIINLEEAIEEMEREIQRLQQLHDTALVELDEKRKNLRNRLLSLEQIKTVAGDLQEAIDALTEEFNAELAQLMAAREAILRRTDLTEEERARMLQELDGEIAALKQRYKERLAELHNELSALDRQKRRMMGELSSELSDLRIKRGDLGVSREDIGGSQISVKLTDSERMRRKRLEQQRLAALLASQGGEEFIFEEESVIPSSTELSSASRMSSADITYLKVTVGKPLTLALAEITAKQPTDPIHYLGHWLMKYRYNQEISERERQDHTALLVERERLAAEKLHRDLEDEAKKLTWEMIANVEDMFARLELDAMSEGEEENEEEEHLDLDMEALDRFDN